jgi:hypothetical protein
MFAGLLRVCFGEKKDIIGPGHGQGTFSWVGRTRLGDRSGAKVCFRPTDCNAPLVRILSCAPKVSPNRKFAAAMRLRHILISQRAQSIPTMDSAPGQSGNPLKQKGFSRMFGAFVLSA